MKPRAVSVTDQTEVAALLAAGKYREGVPLYRKNGGTLLVGEVDVLKTWREKRATDGKRLCQNKEIT